MGKRKLPPWYRMAIGLFDDPKMVKAGFPATVLFIKMIDYCSRHHTDGFIPGEKLDDLESWGGRKSSASRVQVRCKSESGRVRWVRPDNTDLAQHLISVGVLEKCKNGYQLTTFHRWQETTKDIENKRQMNAERQRSFRERNADVTRYMDVTNALQERDSRVSNADVTRESHPPDTDTDTEEGGSSRSDQQYTEPLPWETPPPSVLIRENAQHADEAQVEIDPNNLPETIETVAQLEQLATAWKYGTVMRSKDISHAHKLVSRRPLTRREVLVAKERTDEADGPRKIALFLKILEGEMSRSRRQRESKVMQRQSTPSEARVNAPTSDDEARLRENTRPLTEEELRANQKRVGELLQQLGAR